MCIQVPVSNQMREMSLCQTSGYYYLTTQEKSTVTVSRRHFLHDLATCALAIPLASVGYSGLAMAADRPRVDPEGAAAKALGYVHAAPNPSKSCADCQLYKGSSRAEWGPCPLFSGNLVNARGWCSAWSA
jgi:hypothetical protein